MSRQLTCMIRLLLAPALLWGCATGEGAPVQPDASTPGPDSNLVFPDLWATSDSDALIAPPDARIGDLKAPDKPDRDGDGHCAPGTTDPGKICKSFNDCDDED